MTIACPTCTATSTDPCHDTAGNEVGWHASRRTAVNAAEAEARMARLCAAVDGMCGRRVRRSA